MGYLQRYIESLPEGLASYPEVTAKASFMHDKVAHAPAEMQQLPAEIQQYFDTKVPSSFLVPTVHHFAINLAIRDAMPKGEAFYEFIKQSNRRVLSSPLYGALFAVIKPQLLIRGAAARWSRIHRGIELRAKADHSSCEIELTYPPKLMNRDLADQYIPVFEVVLDLSRARNATFRIADFSDTCTLLEGVW